MKKKCLALSISQILFYGFLRFPISNSFFAPINSLLAHPMVAQKYFDDSCDSILDKSKQPTDCSWWQTDISQW